MDLRKEKPSQNVYVKQTSPVGKRDRLYNSPEYKSAVKDVSRTFQDAIKGKDDRQNGPDSPITKYLRKK